MVFYIVAYWFSNHIVLMTNKNWKNEDFQEQRSRVTIVANMTKTEFIVTVQSGYNMLALTAGLTVIYVFSAVVRSQAIKKIYVEIALLFWDFLLIVWLQRSTGYSIRNPLDPNLAANLDAISECDLRPVHFLASFESRLLLFWPTFQSKSAGAEFIIPRKSSGFIHLDHIIVTQILGQKCVWLSFPLVQCVI
jgi:hypothetical protein